MLEVRTDHIVTTAANERPESETRSWTAIVFAFGLTGIVSGILGIVFSVLSMAGVIMRTRAIDLVSVALILTALAALFGVAHGIDKIGEIERREKHERFMKDHEQFIKEFAKNGRP